MLPFLRRYVRGDHELAGLVEELVRVTDRALTGGRPGKPRPEVHITDVPGDGWKREGHVLRISPKLLNTYDFYSVAEAVLYHVGAHRLPDVHEVPAERLAAGLVHHVLGRTVSVDRNLAKEVHGAYGHVYTGRVRGLSRDVYGVLEKWREKAMRKCRELGLPGTLRTGDDTLRAVRNLPKTFEYLRGLSRDYSRAVSPYDKLAIHRAWTEIHEVLHTPLHLLSGRTFSIPEHVAKEIERKTGVFVGTGPYKTPENGHAESIAELARTGKRLNVRHPFHKY